MFKVWPMPQNLDPRFDENFSHNYLRYIGHYQQEITLSLFQMALMGSSSDTLLIWMPLWMLKLAQYVAGNVIGGLLLG